MREDALARLDRFKGRIPNLFGDYLRVDSLSRDAGRDAIVRPLEEYGRRVAESELGQTGAGVSDGARGRDSRIETPYLQLVLTRLWEEESAAGSRVLRLETLDRLGGAARIVPAHLDAAMAQLPGPERDLAARVFRFLVTPSGTKIAHRASDLAAYAGVPADKVGLLLDRLSGQQARILRGADDGKYEIYHDVLAAAILDWRARYLQATGTRKKTLRFGLAVALLALFVVGIILLNKATANSAPSALGGWVVGVVTIGGLVTLLVGLGIWWGHKHP